MGVGEPFAWTTRRSVFVAVGHDAGRERGSHSCVFALLLMGTFLFFSIASDAQEQARSADRTAILPKITVENSQSVPARLESARMFVENGESIVEYEVTNPSDDPLLRLQTTLLVYDQAGTRQGVQVDEAPPEVLPVDGHGRRVVRLRLRAVAIQEGDQVRLGVTTAATAADMWANTGFDADSDAAVSAHAARAPRVSPAHLAAAEPIVINREDAPATVADAYVVRTSNGAPLVIYATVRNQRLEPLTLNDVEVFIFAADGGIRTRAFKADRWPLAASASRVQRINISGAVANARVVVTLSRAATPTHSWKSPVDLEQARASLTSLNGPW